MLLVFVNGDQSQRGSNDSQKQAALVNQTAAGNATAAAMDATET